MKKILIPIYLLLAACTTTHLPNYTPWQSHALELEELIAWEWQGQIGATTPEGSSSLQVTWQQFSETEFEIHLHGPLGHNQVLFKCDEAECVLRAPQDTFVSQSPEELIFRYFGWDFPVENAIYWLKGMPSPNEPYEFTGNVLQQSGWRVEYQEYHRDLPVPLPRKLVLERDKIRLKIVIQNWSLE